MLSVTNFRETCFDFVKPDQTIAHSPAFNKVNRLDLQVKQWHPQRKGNIGIGGPLYTVYTSFTTFICKVENVKHPGFFPNQEGN